MLVGYRPANFTLVLVLALLMAWASHAIAAITGPTSHLPALPELAPSAKLAFVESIGISYSDHSHSSATADHLHETPYLGFQIGLPGPATKIAATAAQPFAVSIAPVYLLERPPRLSFRA